MGVHLTAGDAALWVIAIVAVLIFCFGTHVVS